jgi:hypothetical protein
MIRRDAIAALIGLKPIAGEIRTDVIYAVRVNAKLDTLWQNCHLVGSTRPPSGVASDPVYLDPWESGWQRQAYVIGITLPRDGFPTGVEFEL